jgi:hypothetical protein
VPYPFELFRAEIAEEAEAAEKKFSGEAALKLIAPLEFMAPDQ